MFNTSANAASDTLEFAIFEKPRLCHRSVALKLPAIAPPRLIRVALTEEP